MTITIEISDDDAPRIAEAFGGSPGESATSEEVVAIVKNFLNEGVVGYERGKAMMEIKPPPLDLVK